MSKIAFVLSGGGAKGSWEAGVIYALGEKGINPDIVYGTSVGSLNAAGCAYLGYHGLKNVWFNIKGNSDILSPTSYKWIWSWVKMIYGGSGIYSTKPLKKMLDKYIYGTPFCEAVSCSVDIASGSIEYCSNKETDIETFKESVRASCSIPLMMEAVETKDKVFVDGGVREQTPLFKAIQDGYKKIYIILANPYQINPNEKWKCPTKFFKWFHVLRRSIDDVMCHEIFINDLNVFLTLKSIGRLKDIELHIFAPEKPLISTLEFDPIKIKTSFEMGCLASELDLNKIYETNKWLKLSF